MVDAARVSPALLAVVLVAVLLGAAASMLAAAAPPIPAGAASEIDFQAGPLFWAILFTAPLIAVTAIFIYRRATGNSLPFPRAQALFFLGILAMMVLFVVIFQFVGGGGALSSLVPTSPSSPSNPGSNNSSGGSGSGPTGFGGVASPGLPGWVAFLAIVGVAVVVAAVLVPMLVRRSAARRGGPDLAGAVATRRALRQAAGALDQGGDPRTVILGLYQGLLDRVEPLVGDLDPRTPGEIRDQDLATLGVRREAAHELTALFEEARYSTHPMGPDASGRARSAIRQLEADLYRAGAVE